MDINDTYQGRRPSIGFGRSGPYVRGLRSKPGAPQHDPTTNVPMSGNYQPTNWESVFQPRMGKPAAPTTPEAPSNLWGGGNIDWGGTDLNAMLNGPTHQQQWSQPARRPGFPGMQQSGWQTTSQSQLASIFDRYKTPDTSGVPATGDSIGKLRDFQRDDKFGWASAFDRPS